MSDTQELPSFCKPGNYELQTWSHLSAFVSSEIIAVGAYLWKMNNQESKPLFVAGVSAMALSFLFPLLAYGCPISTNIDNEVEPENHALADALTLFAIANAVAIPITILVQPEMLHINWSFRRPSISWHVGSCHT